MARFSHQCTIAFTVRSDEDDGGDITPAQFEAAILKRLADVKASAEWSEAIAIVDTDDVAD